MASWLQKLLDWKTYQSTLHRLRKTKIQRRSVPLLKVGQVLYAKLVHTNVHQQASAIAFSFTLSLFPTILFLFSLIPFVAGTMAMPDLVAQVLALMSQVIPEGIFEFVAPTIADILQNPRVDLLSFGFLFAIYAATSGVVDLMHTFNANFAYSEKRSFFKKRLIAVGLTFLFAFLLVFAVAIIPVAELAFHFLQKYRLLGEQTLYYLFGIFRYALAFLVFYVGISYIYYIAPAVRRQWRFFSLGSSLAALFVIISTKGFSYYLSNFATYNKLYGSIGTLIALMIWLYLLAWILLLGFALNASIAEAKMAHEKEIKQRLNMLEDLEN
ncbi:MAG: YihY/virulence factor BrkB family protein [Microscillaceae bacterium]